MHFIDSHVHVWTHDPLYPWAIDTPELPVYDAHPDMLLQLMKLESVECAVLVQYIGYRWDNRYVADVLKAYPQRFRGVCRVDPEDGAAPDHLSYWTEVHGFHGVRLSPAPDASGDWFRGPLMRPLFQRSAELGIPVVILTKPSRLRDLLDIVEAVPDVDIVVDHLGDCDVGNPGHRDLLLNLARYHRTYLKTGHVWSNSSGGYPWRDQHALIKQVCEWFGADRIMWGSDWPFCLRRATYAQALSFVRDEMEFLSEAELAWILGGTALRLWPFPQASSDAAGQALLRRDGDVPATRT